MSDSESNGMAIYRAFLLARDVAEMLAEAHTLKSAGKPSPYHIEYATAKMADLLNAMPLAAALTEAEVAEARAKKEAAQALTVAA